MGKARSQPFGGHGVTGFTLVGSSLACKYYTQLEVNAGGKYSSFLHYKFNYSCKRFYDTGPGAYTNALAYIMNTKCL